ncbi:MAG TPA: class I SAM-dependent methyltransferase [Microlunatus sp.]
MHASGRAHMQLCIETYLRRRRHYEVVDFGSRSATNPEGTHTDLFARYDCSFTGVDILAGPGVDVVMKKPYRIPLKSNSVDLIISGQTFEHIPFFWVSFLEMIRILKPGGLIFITAPSRGHEHATMDLWRYYPDSMRALAAFGRMRLLEMHTDLPPRVAGTRRLNYSGIDARNAYWGDSVGVFRKPKQYSKLVVFAREPLIWWANRVGGIEHIQKPSPLPERKAVGRGLWAARPLPTKKPAAQRV